MSTPTIWCSVSVEEISEPETNRRAQPLLYSNYLLIPAGKVVRLVCLAPPTRSPDGRPQLAPTSHGVHTPAFFPDAASTRSSVLGKEQMLSQDGRGDRPSATTWQRAFWLWDRTSLDEYSFRQGPGQAVENRLCTASPVPVQSPMSMPGSSHQPCRSPHAMFISGLNPRLAGDLGDPPDTLRG
ncbi:hypothetical protein K438DRAFT_1776917 [Mycena galopus ATCC 62051]|nr:hypothetical protein K438DRAFT_1776917 [Mycena galopus ATCC 62051]